MKIKIQTLVIVGAALFALAYLEVKTKQPIWEE
jgi:hypothetical protein